MAKIINFDSIKKGKDKEKFEKDLYEKIDKIEKELGIEDEPLTVLTESVADTIMNNLIDVKDSITEILQELFNYEECEGVPWE